MVNFGPPYPESIKRAEILLRGKFVPTTINTKGKHPCHFPCSLKPHTGWLVGNGDFCLFFTAHNIARWIDSRENNVEWFHAWYDGTFHLDSCQFFTNYINAQVAAIVNKSWLRAIQTDNSGRQYGEVMYSDEL